MTNRERVIAAIKHEKKDYTPHSVIFTGQMNDKMFNYTGNPDYLGTINNHIVKAALRKRGVPIPGKPERFLDDFGIEWDRSGADKDIGVVAQYPIDSAEDLANYTPPPVDEDYIRAQCEKCMREKGDNFAIASIGFTVFERGWSLCGMEGLLCFMLTDPGAVGALFDKLAARNIEMAKIAMEYDFDGVLFGDDWGQQKGLIMGAPLWRELLKPRVASMYAEVKKAGKFVAQHSCGDNSEIMDDLIDIGLDIYQTFQPEIYDMQAFKDKYKGRLTVWGGISTQAQLPFLTADEIYHVTKNAISVLGEGGGYIAAPTHEVSCDTPPENIEAMVRAFREQTS